jgi:hypothetical protein
MVDVSRRSFLFGSLAAVAAAKLQFPFATAAPTPKEIPGPRFYTRCMFDNGSSAPAVFTLWRSDDRLPIMHIGVPQYGQATWISVPGEEIYCRPETHIRLDCERIFFPSRPEMLTDDEDEPAELALGPSHAHLFFDARDDGRLYSELHDFTSNGHAVLTYLDVGPRRRAISDWLRAYRDEIRSLHA